MKPKVTIVGAGLVGSLLSIYMVRRGYKVEVFDKRPDPKHDVSEGRSINLAVSERAWTALREIGLEVEIKNLGLPMYGRQVHATDGTQTYQAYSADSEAIYSTSRSLLNQKLIEVADRHHDIDFHFDQECVAVNHNQLIFKSGKKDYDLLFGTDGANSVVRHFLEQSHQAEFQVDFLQHQYIELHIDPINSDWALPNNVLHIWPRKAFMLIALPNLDKSFTCTLFLPSEGHASVNSIKTKTDLSNFIETHFADVSEILQIPDNLIFGKLGTLKGQPWHLNDKVCLLGDAAHAIVPFYGQGMNAGFEDCFVLNQILDKTGEFNFEVFQKTRKPDTDAIAELALQNFIEMRDLVGESSFLTLKKLDQKLHEAFPRLWNPIYNQVSFTNIPYAQALEGKKLQEVLLNKIDSQYEWQKKWPATEIKLLLTKYFE